MHGPFLATEKLFMLPSSVNAEAPPKSSITDNLKITRFMMM